MRCVGPRPPRTRGASSPRALSLPITRSSGRCGPPDAALAVLGPNTVPPAPTPHGLYRRDVSDAHEADDERWADAVVMTPLRPHLQRFHNTAIRQCGVRRRGGWGRGGGAIHGHDDVPARRRQRSHEAAEAAGRCPRRPPAKTKRLRRTRRSWTRCRTVPTPPALPRGGEDAGAATARQTSHAANLTAARDPWTRRFRDLAPSAFPRGGGGAVTTPTTTPTAKTKRSRTTRRSTWTAAEPQSYRMRRFGARRTGGVPRGLKEVGVNADES
jgi:hypothetical protein